MASKDPNVIEIDGISFYLEPNIFDNWEIVETMADSYDDELPDEQKVLATVRLMRLVYKDEYARIKRELKEKNGGKLTNEAMSSFLVATMGAVGAKN